jgi:hypothetical protein
MLSSEKNNGPRQSADELPQDRRKNNNPAGPTDENVARNRSNDDHTEAAQEAARISREDAERNLRPDPDPDDPVSP